MKNKLNKALEVLGMLTILLFTIVLGTMTIEVSIGLWNKPNTLMVIGGLVLFLAGCLIPLIGVLLTFTYIKEKIK